MDQNTNMWVTVALFVGVFYFFIMRPQSKRAKEQKSMLNQIQQGDEVVTTGGIVGKIVKLKDQFLVLAVQDNANTEMTFQRQAIASVLPKGTLKSLR